jgi:hypothetical protein
VDEALDIEHVLPDVPLKVKLLTRCIDLGQVAEHVGAILPPCDLFWVEHRNLSQECVNISARSREVDVHKLVLVCELRGKVAEEEALNLRVFL